MSRILSISTLNDFGPDIPEHIAKNLKDLHEANSTIDELEASLRCARSKRNGIRVRLAAYQVSRAPIFWIPREILSQIFQYHPEDINRNHILMLVCKEWSQVLDEEPILWRNIVLTLESTKTIPRYWSFALECLNRSRTALLDIYIDASNLDIVDFPKLVERYSKNFRKAHLPDRGDRFWRLINTRSTSQVSEEKRCEAAIQMTFNILRGFENEAISRWRLFRLDTAYRLNTSSVIMLWNSIDHATENLITLAFKAVDTLQENVRDRTTLKGFPSLPALKNLEINLGVPFDTIKFQSNMLQRLSLMDQASSRHFVLSVGHRYTHLHTLELYFPHVWGLPESMQPVNLLSLHILIIWGHMHAPLTTQLNAPNLRRLCIMSSPQTCYNASPLFSSSITDLYWDAVILPDHVSWAALKFLLTHLSGLCRIRLRRQPEWGISLELRLIDEMRVTGVPLARLKHLHLVSGQNSFFTNKDLQVVDVSPPPWLAFLKGENTV